MKCGADVAGVSILCNLLLSVLPDRPPTIMTRTDDLMYRLQVRLIYISWICAKHYRPGRKPLFFLFLLFFKGFPLLSSFEVHACRMRESTQQMAAVVLYGVFVPLEGHHVLLHQCVLMVTCFMGQIVVGLMQLFFHHSRSSASN